MSAPFTCTCLWQRYSPAALMSSPCHPRTFPVMDAQRGADCTDSDYYESLILDYLMGFVPTFSTSPHPHTPTHPQRLSYPAYLLKLSHISLQTMYLFSCHYLCSFKAMTKSRKKIPKDIVSPFFYFFKKFFLIMPLWFYYSTFENKAQKSLSSGKYAIYPSAFLLHVSKINYKFPLLKSSSLS